MEEVPLFGKQNIRIIKLGDFEVALPEDDSATFLVLLISLIELNDPKVNNVLLKCGVSFSDVNGKQYFPREDTELPEEINGSD